VNCIGDCPVIPGESLVICGREQDQTPILGVQSGHTSAHTIYSSPLRTGPYRPSHQLCRLPLYTNSVTLLFPHTLPQIRPIRNQNINLLRSADTTANMMISGRVSGVHRESGTFTMTVYPVIRGASANAHLEIRAVLRCNLFAPNPAQLSQNREG
jgi:hypothetical protein